MNIAKEKIEEKKNNNKIINKNKSISNSKINNNNNLIPFRKLNLNKYNTKSFMQKYRNNSKKNIFPSNKIINTKDSKYLLYNRIIKNKMKKKENIFNFDSLPLSKTKESYININYQNPLPNLHQTKNKTIIHNFQQQQVEQVQQPQTNQAKGKNTFFNQYASSSVYLPSRKYEQKEKSYLKEYRLGLLSAGSTSYNNVIIPKYRLGLLSAGSTSYNNVIIPMISLTRQPSGFFNENEKSFGNDNLKRSRKNYMTFRKKNIVSSDCLRQNRKVRNLSSYSKIAGNEEFKDVEKLIPKFHKIKIEKGMMDSNLTKTLKDNFVANYNRSRKLKIRNEFLKLINDKEKIKNI